MPTVNDEVVKPAVPPLNVAVPKVVAESRNVTVPPGVPAPGALAETVAVNVTVWPNTEGLAELATVVVEPSLFTVCNRLPDVLALKLASPA